MAARQADDVIFHGMTTPSWVGPTVAIALVVIALGFVAIAAGVVMAGRVAGRQAERLTDEVASLRKDLAPTIEAVNRVAGSGAEVGGRLKEEILAVVDVSRRLRRQAVRGARRVEGRLEELDALYEVVSTEVTETALDVAATIRSVRTGASALSRIKRFLVRGRR